MRAVAIRALASREEAVVTSRLLPLLDDPDRHVRAAAVHALDDREDPAVTGGLLGCLDDPDWSVRQAAAQTLARRAAPGDLIALGRRARTLQPNVLDAVYEIAERMVTRSYLLLPAESQTAVRADLAWLSTAVLHSPVS